MKAEAPIGCRRCGSPVGYGLPLIVGAGFIPPAGVCAAAECGGMRASRPTAARVVTAVPVWRVVFGRLVGEGFIHPANLAAALTPTGGLRPSSTNRYRYHHPVGPKHKIYS